jgi:hypothetical protein
VLGSWLLNSARERPPEHSIVEFTAALAADLATLTETLDDSDAVIAETLQELAADARLAVPSYLGLSVAITASGQQLSLTALDDRTKPGDILSSLLLPLPLAQPDGNGAEPIIALIMYAGSPGAFIDLAADLSRLTHRDLPEFVLDEHIALAHDPDEPSGLGAVSVVNQAIGVLIARGNLPEHAERELATQAACAGVDSHIAAVRILASLGDPPPEIS